MNFNVNYETDKNLIKNGMYFKCGEKYYIKVGKRCIEFSVDKEHIIDFEDIKQEDITMIFKSNGASLLKKQEVSE